MILQKPYSSDDEEKFSSAHYMIPLLGYIEAYDIKWGSYMIVLKQFHDHAAAEYLCNVYEFIGAGEGRDLSPNEVMHIKLKFIKVERWYEKLSPAGKRRVDVYLLQRYG